MSFALALSRAVSRSIIPLGVPGLKLHLGSVTRRLSGDEPCRCPPGVTMLLAPALWTFLRALSTGAAGVALENLALRHQLLVLQRSVGRPRLSRWDRIFWVCLSRLWAGWRTTLVIVRPATVLAWHRRGFQLYWRWKSRPNPVGRPRLDAELRTLIRRMARENPTWGRRRIQAELALLGYAVAELTVAKYMHRTSPRPSPTWVGIEPRRAHWVEIDQATFPRAPLRSCTVGFPEYSSDLGFPPEAFPTQGRLKRWLAYTPPRVGLPPGSSFKDGSSDPRR